MQQKFSFRYLLIILLILIILPINLAWAKSQHFNSDELKNEVSFKSDSGDFELVIPEVEYQESLDVYLYQRAEDNILDEVNAISKIYSYYIYSDEVIDESEFTITLNYNGDYTNAKTVYYYNRQTKAWQIASNKAFFKKLTFKIKGKKNDLVIVGTNIADFTNEAGEGGQVSKIFNFDINSVDSELKGKEVCLPYISSYLKPHLDDNNELEVKKLQTFLREYEGFAELPSTGYYGNMTYNSVAKFQEKYAKETLWPWDLTKGTGRVLKTTLSKINQLYCDEYQEDKDLYEVNIPYEIGSSKARSGYYLSNEGSEDEEWLKLKSFDNFKTKTVTSIINKELAKIALFEEKNVWVGEASWYAWKNGNFAASRDFPKGTKLKVTNQSAGTNRGKSVIVTINDYGPEKWTGRIIDLDKFAYGQIGNLRGGVMAVSVEVVKE